MRLRRTPPLTDWLRRALVIGGALLGLALLGQGRVAAAQEGPAPRARLGEAFTWNMRILGLFDAGRARLAITPPYRSGAGSQINVVGEAEATGLAKALTGLHDDYRLTLDGATLLPLRLQIDETGFRIRTVVLQFAGKRIDILSRMPKGEQRLVGQLPTEPLEPVAVLLLLRAARLLEGDRLELIILDGTNFYQGSIEVIAREELTTILGTHRAIRLLCRGERVDATGRKMGRPPRQATMWLSDDVNRIPLRVAAQTDYGTGEFELTSYEPPRRAIPLPRQLSGIIEHQRP